MRKVPPGKEKIVRIVDTLPKDELRIHGVAGYYKNYHVIVKEYDDCVVETWYVNICAHSRDITGGQRRLNRVSQTETEAGKSAFSPAYQR